MNVSEHLARLAAKMCGIFDPRNTDKKNVEIIEQGCERLFSEEKRLQHENSRLRRALDLLGVPAQALKDPDKAPPLHVSVALAKRAMEVVDE